MKKTLARWLLRVTGWQTVGVRPTSDHYVLIAAPHTSNWDFPLMLIFAAAFDIKVTWMAKHSLFYPPMGWIMRALGGMPIIRHETRTWSPRWCPHSTPFPTSCWLCPQRVPGKSPSTGSRAFTTLPARRACRSCLPSWILAANLAALVRRLP
ncbi:MAG: 1-acyl-sn-glycerol-3-phosphate acyltransferase [Haliea sp.]|nr:1-acyl-sn-glycerol-3-phosphate acyltransferase [Haliea sp.]